MPSRPERRKGEDAVPRFSSRLIPLLTLALLLLGACDTFPAQEAIGAALAPDGRPEVSYVSCPGEAVEQVQVVRPVDNPGGDDDVVLWAITRTAPRPIAQQSFVVGADPPAGFAESVPLPHELPSTIALAALVTTDRVSGVVVPFRLSNLRSARILTFSGQYATPTDFRQSALSRCNT
jgi:hypothetical protein